jgi:hypothetical protein
MTQQPQGRRAKDLLTDLVSSYVLKLYGHVGRPGRQVFEIDASGRIMSEHFELVPTLADTSAEDLPVGPRHSPDFRSVECGDGTAYIFSATQAAVVRVLWESWERGVPDCGNEMLLEACGSEGNRLRDTFRNHAAWGKFIRSMSRGTCRLVFPEPDQACEPGDTPEARQASAIHQDAPARHTRLADQAITPEAKPAATKRHLLTNGHGVLNGNAGRA